MIEGEEDKVFYFLKQNPRFVERYVKENCSEAQLHQWIKQIGRTKNDVEVQATETKVARRSSEIDGYLRTTSMRAASVQGLHKFHAAPRASLAISSQLLQSTRLRRTSRDVVLSRLIDSVCENISIDGYTLYLKDSYRNAIYPKPIKQPLIGATNNPQLYPIESRQLLACLAAERKQLMNSADIPKGIRVAGLSVAPLTEAKHVLAQPILNAAEDIVAVFEIYRSPTRRAFTTAEIKLLRSMARWARFVIESEDKLDLSEKAQRLGDFILEVVRNFFSRIKNMDSVIKSIMEHAKQLVKAERVTLFIVDQKKNELYSSILDMGDVTCAKFVQDDSTEIRLPLGEGIAGYVATTGLPVRSNDTYSDSRFYRKVDETYNQVTKSVLAMPLTDGREVVGVIEMINKHEGIFTEEDENLLRIYSVYCGLAINVARMYDRIYRSDRKYRVALEVLTYHSCVSEAEVASSLPCIIPDKIPGINRYDFSPWDVEENKEIPTVMFMIYDLAGKLLIDKMTLLRFVLTVRKNYRPVAYHNWDHGFSVAHSMYFLLTVGENRFSLLEKICLFIASLCHDLDHRGYDNRFMKKFSTPLASLYSSSPMEHHHFNMTITILQQRDHNIFRHFRNASYRNILGIIKHAILSTDLATFWTSKSRLESFLDTENGIEWTDHTQRMSVVSIAMPTCDLCAMYKPWDIQVKVVMLIMQEFWAQGDQEKASASKPLTLMDRDQAMQLADGQVGFIRAICVPCYNTIVRVFPQVSIILDVVQKNLEKWDAIAGLPYEERERILQEQMQQKFSKVRVQARVGS